MKNFKLWQKVGLIGLICLPLTLGGIGFIFKKNSGLESRITNIPPITGSTEQVKEINLKGYEVPDLTGYTKKKPVKIDTDDDGVKETIYQVFKKDGEDDIIKLMTPKGVWGWGKMKNENDPWRYAIIDSDGRKNSDNNQIFEEKYSRGNIFSVPEWANH